MKVGDLVKYSGVLTGLEHCMGVIIGFNGKAVEVQWLVVKPSPPREKSVELPEFLEVVSEAR